MGQFKWWKREKQERKRKKEIKTERKSLRESDKERKIEIYRKIDKRKMEKRNREKICIKEREKK